MQYEVHGGKTSGERIYPRAPFFYCPHGLHQRPSGAAHCSSSRKDYPIGDAYRERVKGYVSRLAVL